MKRTSYIFIGALLALLLIAIIAPPVLLKRTSPQKIFARIEYHPTKDITEHFDTTFTAVDVSREYFVESLPARIVGDADSLPYITIDSLLLKYAEIRIVDDCLKIYLGTPVSDDEYNRPYKFDADKQYPAFVLHVPAKGIRSIHCSECTVEGLEGDGLAVGASSTTITNCRFNTRIY